MLVEARHPNLQNVKLCQTLWIALFFERTSIHSLHGLLRFMGCSTSWEGHFRQEAAAFSKPIAWKECSWRSVSEPRADPPIPLESVFDRAPTAGCLALRLNYTFQKALRNGFSRRKGERGLYAPNVPRWLWTMGEPLWWTWHVAPSLSASSGATRRRAKQAMPRWSRCSSRKPSASSTPTPVAMRQLICDGLRRWVVVFFASCSDEFCWWKLGRFLVADLGESKVSLMLTGVQWHMTQIRIFQRSIQLCA